ncbi:hypothetical protein PRIPAC_75619 [Pristionchus pacificus]|uniref:Amino_oxidase domain-containing protein n=1 Tax=Pristionchus pacificus TaxID=54126 RepID=A0A2A6CSK2_PRIPA|nr:hypothetical protein PRIPAC_75619 [Pristionchus pacificus]|eukprot:PDM81023.1 hypothetical protein PRIPAC_36026 [Pristionchus pacificus]
MDNPHRVVIIGSGPTAVGAALRLNELIEQGTIYAEVLIVESANRVGGLASSVTTPRGFTFDLGVHVTGQSKYHEFLRTIDEAVGEWNYIPRSVKASMRHVFSSKDPRECFIPYPVQDSISHFPAPLWEQCERELDELASKVEYPIFFPITRRIFQEPSSSCANFSQFALSTFGETLTKLFIRPYNEKIWTVSLETLGACWVEGRVPRPAKKDKNENMEVNGKRSNAVVFRYPSKMRGVGEVWKKIVTKLPSHWIQLNSTVTKIETEDKRVTLSNGFSLPYDTIISTIPIDLLGKISGLAPEIPLKHSKVVLVGIGLSRPQPIHTEPLSWVYFPQPDIVFYRVTFISNFNEHLTPNAALYWSVLCEIGCDSETEIDEKAITEKAIQDLISEGIIPGVSSIVDRWINILPYGYPIPTVNRNEVLSHTQNLLESNRIYSRGRFGSWLYEVANQDHSFTMGREVVGRIFLNDKETVHTTL